MNDLVDAFARGFFGVILLPVLPLIYIIAGGGDSIKDFWNDYTNIFW